MLASVDSSERGRGLMAGHGRDGEGVSRSSCAAGAEPRTQPEVATSAGQGQQAGGQAGNGPLGAAHQRRTAVRAATPKSFVSGLPVFGPRREK